MADPPDWNLLSGMSCEDSDIENSLWDSQFLQGSSIEPSGFSLGGEGGRRRPVSVSLYKSLPAGASRSYRLKIVPHGVTPLPVGDDWVARLPTVPHKLKSPHPLTARPGSTDHHRPSTVPTSRASARALRCPATIGKKALLRPPVHRRIARTRPSASDIPPNVREEVPAFESEASGQFYYYLSGAGDPEDGHEEHPDGVGNNNSNSNSSTNNSNNNKSSNSNSKSSNNNNNNINLNDDGEHDDCEGSNRGISSLNSSLGKGLQSSSLNSSFGRGLHAGSLNIRNSPQESRNLHNRSSLGSYYQQQSSRLHNNSNSNNSNNNNSNSSSPGSYPQRSGFISRHSEHFTPALPSSARGPTSTATTTTRQRQPQKIFATAAKQPTNHSPNTRNQSSSQQRQQDHDQLHKRNSSNNSSSNSSSSSLHAFPGRRPPWRSSRCISGHSQDLVAASAQQDQGQQHQQQHRYLLPYRPNFGKEGNSRRPGGPTSGAARKSSNISNSAGNKKKSQVLDADLLPLAPFNRVRSLRLTPNGSASVSPSNSRRSSLNNALSSLLDGTSQDGSEREGDQQQRQQQQQQQDGIFMGRLASFASHRSPDAMSGSVSGSFARTYSGDLEEYGRHAKSPKKAELKVLCGQMMHSMTHSFQKDVWEACKLDHPEGQPVHDPEQHLCLRERLRVQAEELGIRDLLRRHDDKTKQVISYRDEPENAAALQTEQAIAWLAQQSGWTVLAVETVFEAFCKHAEDGLIDLSSSAFALMSAEVIEDLGEGEVEELLDSLLTARRCLGLTEQAKGPRRKRSFGIQSSETTLAFGDFFLGLAYWIPKRRRTGQKQLATERWSRLREAVSATNSVAAAFGATRSTINVLVSEVSGEDVIDPAEGQMLQRSSSCTQGSDDKIENESESEKEKGKERNNSNSNSNSNNDVDNNDASSNKGHSQNSSPVITPKSPETPSKRGRRGADGTSPKVSVQASFSAPEVLEEHHHFEDQDGPDLEHEVDDAALGRSDNSNGERHDEDSDSEDGPPQLSHGERVAMVRAVSVLSLHRGYSRKSLIW